MKGYKDVMFVRDDRPLDRFQGATPVAIEVREGSEPLHTFVHPDTAVYVFGPEDGGITGGIAAKCHRFVVIPTRHCLNLATAVATVIWDRYSKRAGDGPFVTPGAWEGRG